MLEIWWITTSLVFLESISFNLSRSGLSSSFKFKNFKLAPVFWATSCQGTMALWCSATVSITCSKYNVRQHLQLDMQNNVIAKINLLHINTITEMYLGHKPVSLYALKPEAKKTKRWSSSFCKKSRYSWFVYFLFFLIRIQKYYLKENEREIDTKPNW